MRRASTILIAWTVALFAAAADARAQQQEARVSLTFAPPHVIVVREGTHDRIDLEAARGVFHPDEGAGLPDLPLVRVRLALPAGATPGAPRLEGVRQARIRGGVLPKPVQPPRPLQERSARPPLPDPAPVPADARVYGAGRPYPPLPATLAGTARMGGALVATVHVSPLLWNAGTGDLDLLTELTVVLPYTAPAPAAARAAAAPRTIPAGRALVDNPTALPDAPALPDAAPGQPRASLLILTDDHEWLRPERGPFARGRRVGDMAAAFQPLADDHTALGLETRIVKIGDIVDGRYGDFRRNAAGLPARDLCEIIRNFIQGCAYPLWGTRYLLLGGDTNIVPVRHILSEMMDWHGTTPDWTAADPWNAFSAICRSWWPGCVGAASAYPGGSGADKIVDGDPATGWAPPAFRRSMFRPFRPVVVAMQLDWPNAIWPAYNRLVLAWDRTPTAWMPIEVRVSSDGGRTWASRGFWPAGSDEMNFGRGDWLLLGSGLRVMLVFPLGWPSGSRLMELEAYGAQNTAYQVDSGSWMLAGVGLKTHQPLIFQRYGEILGDLIPYAGRTGVAGPVDAAAATARPAAAAPAPAPSPSPAYGWRWVRGPFVAGDAPSAGTPTPWIMVSGPAPSFGGASHWGLGEHPLLYAADAYYGDLEGDHYVGGAQFDAQNPWHDFDRSGNGWCSTSSDGIDSVHEVGVGRAPVHDPTQAALFVRKARSYLRYRDVATGRSLGDFASRGLLGAKQLWGGAPAGDEGFTSRERVQNLIWLVQDPSAVIERYYEHPDPFPGALPIAGLFGAFNAGWNRVGILSHSGPDYCTGFTPAIAAAAANAPSYSIIFSYGCSPNAFDHHGGDSVTEAFLNAVRGGACAFTGNSRYGWGGDGLIEEAFWSAVATTPRLGDMLHAREARTWDAPWLRVNLLGDPALPVWSRIPWTMSVRATTVAAPSAGSPRGQYRIQATYGRGAPVEGAVVAVTEGGSLVATARIDAQGFAVVSASPQATIGISAIAEPAFPGRAFVPLIAPLANLLGVRPAPAEAAAESR
jgi:hypothetical protein